MHPADSSWKRALDQILLLDRYGEEKFSEGRGILVSKIRNGETKRLLRTLPSGAKYIKRCLHALWALKVRQDRRHVATVALDHALDRWGDALNGTIGVSTSM